MKLFTFEVNRQAKLGAECGGQLIDLAVAYAAMLAARGYKPGMLNALPPEMLASCAPIPGID